MSGWLRLRGLARWRCWGWCWRARAEAAWSDALQDGLSAVRAAEQRLLERARQAIVVGGVVLYRHRHAVAGAAIGCLTGSMAATALSVGGGLATGGAALAGTAPAWRWAAASAPGAGACSASHSTRSIRRALRPA